MILTVTLNPLLERRLIYNKINYGEVNRTTREEFKAGGKGINVSRQLGFLEIHNTALTILGGNNGKLLRKILAEEQINVISVNSKSDTRSAALAVDETETKITSFFGPNQQPSGSEIAEFKSRLEKAIANSSIVVLSGSSPSREANELFSFAIDVCNREDKISVLDTYGEHLKECIEKAPTVIHNNVDEIESSLNISLQSEKDISDYLNLLYSNGIKLSFITNGGKPGFASKFDFKYKFIPPKTDVVDPTGSGDAFVAGICYGLDRSLVFEEFLSFAAAAGTANSKKWQACDSTYQEIIDHAPDIKITPIGKKMKIIDDSPNY